jgi:hypothetical protein
MSWFAKLFKKKAKPQKEKKARKTIACSVCGGPHTKRTCTVKQEAAVVE